MISAILGGRTSPASTQDATVGKGGAVPPSGADAFCAVLDTLAGRMGRSMPPEAVEGTVREAEVETGEAEIPEAEAENGEVSTDDLPAPAESGNDLVEDPEIALPDMALPDDGNGTPLRGDGVVIGVEGAEGKARQELASASMIRPEQGAAGSDVPEMSPAPEARRHAVLETRQSQPHLQGLAMSAGATGSAASPAPSEISRMPIAPEGIVIAAKLAQAVQPPRAQPSAKMLSAEMPIPQAEDTELPASALDRIAPGTWTREDRAAIPVRQGQPVQVAVPGGAPFEMSATALEVGAEPRFEPLPIAGPTGPSNSVTAPAVPTIAQVTPQEMRQAGQAIAEATVKASGSEIELALSPEELGRVRITMNATEAGMTVTVHVERDETLSLLRRHLSDLAAAFREAGLGEANIDLGRGGERGENSRGEAPVHRLPAEAESTAQMRQPGRIVPDGALDIRF